MFSFVSDIFLQLLTFLANIFSGNFGLAIITLTLIVRSLLLPLTLPALKSQKHLKDLKPQLDQLKKKYGHDKKLYSQKQLELYQQQGINPAAGCLPQVVQLFFLIILYRVLINSLTNSTITNIDLNFLWLHLDKPDTKFILPTLAGAFQLILGIMLLPATSTTAEKQLAQKTKTKKDDQQAEDMTEMAQTMQSQMVFLMPAFTFFLALRFPSGLALYWVTTTIFSLVQQYLISGPGGLRPHLSKLGLTKA